MAKNLRFIQCGDLHLGSPFHNLAAIDDRWQRIIGKAPVRAFQKIVQLAIDKQVHACSLTAKKRLPFTGKAMLKANSGKIWPGSSTVPPEIPFLSACSTPKSAVVSRRMLRAPLTI